MLLQSLVNKIIVSFVLIVISLFYPQSIFAAGMIFTNEYTQIAPSEFRALLISDGRKQILYDSLTFTVNPLVVGNFAWVIPVPSKPEVTLTKEDIFLNLEEQTEKKFDKQTIINKVLYPDLIEETAIPQARAFTRPINYIQNNVFGGETGLQDLQNWLETFGYLIPKKGASLLEEYQKKGWYFVTLEINALHIQYNATDSLTINGAHTYPVKIAFESDVILYPRKFASVQPDLDSQDMPYSFDYQRPSEDLLGEKNESVDQVLAYQSINKFPRMPLDYLYTRTDLYILSKHKVESDSFITTFASEIEPLKIEDETYEDIRFMTAMYDFTPQIQLSDVTITQSPNDVRVNPRISKGETILRVFIIIAPVILLVYVVHRLQKRRIH